LSDEETHSAENDRWWSRIQPDERRGVAFAFAWLFFLLLAYFIIRPVRETMGSLVGTRTLQMLFLASFMVMLVAVPAYGALVARLPRRWLVRAVYHFFALCLVGFWSAMQVESPTFQTWTARVFFVWVSVFGVFSTSVFWSVLADMFTNRQGKRLFGLVAAGGTVGAVMGSLVASQLASQLSTGALLLLPVVVLELGLWCAWRLEHQSAAIRRADPQRVDTEDASQRPTGGGLLVGITHVLKSPYLGLICLFLLFVHCLGTQLYFEQAEIVNAAIETREERTELFAYLDLGTQVVTLFVQVFLSGLIMRRLGVAFALVLLPLIYFSGFTALAIEPSLEVLVFTVVAARAAGYGIAVPAREVLFTVVSREDKYKSKSFIDTVVLRGGDTLGGQIFGSLRGWGLSLTAINLVLLPATAVWAVVSWRLGRRQRAMAQQSLAMAVPGERDGRE